MIGLHIVPWIDKHGNQIWRLVYIGCFWTRVLAQSQNVRLLLNAANNMANGAMP